MKWRLSVAAFVLFSSGLMYATVGEVARLSRLAAPTPPEIAADWIVRNAEDEAGRRASFRILLFTDDFRWQLSSYHALEEVGGAPRFTGEMKTVLNRAEEIICIGASSEEIVPGLTGAAGRAREEARAARRARRIAAWVRDALDRPLPVRMLNAGHHLPSGAGADTSDQRRVVIVLVLKRDEGTNMDEALRSAMMRESATAPVFHTLLTRYSLTTGKTFQWVE